MTISNLIIHVVKSLVKVFIVNKTDSVDFQYSAFSGHRNDLDLIGRHLNVKFVLITFYTFAFE